MNYSNLFKMNGITLVALVITVILLMILAGVSVSLITNGDSFLGRVTNAADRYNNAVTNRQEWTNAFIDESIDYEEDIPDTDPDVPDGSFDPDKGHNTPDVTDLPSNTMYITWDWNDTTKYYDIDETPMPTPPDDWYDYSIGNWANIKSTSNGLEAYWVWIPRFAYKLPETDTAKQIEIIFVKDKTTTGANNETCYYSTDTAITSDGSGLYVNKTSDAASKWIVHPAFTFGDTQLPGIWVAKFEASNFDCTTDKSVGQYNNKYHQVTIKPGVSAWRSIQVANAFSVCENITKSGGVIGNNNSNLDSHLMKNMEWGAVAILSQSIYGIFNSTSATGPTTSSGDGSLRIWNNSNKTYLTGHAGTKADAYYEDSTSAYNTLTGIKASTTGTVYGIYDMAAGSYERVMGFMLPDVTGSTEPAVGYTSSTNTGFKGLLYDGTLYNYGRNLPDSKYYDLYTYGTSYADYSRGLIGDATSELQPAELESSNPKTWNNDAARFVYKTSVVFCRGYYQASSTRAGIFSFYGSSGGASSGDSFRPVFINM